MSIFFEGVRRHLPADDPQALDSSIQVVVEAIMETLPDAAAQAVSDATGVPPPPSPAQALDSTGFSVRVFERLKHIDDARRREIVTATIGVLGTRLPDGPKKLVQRRLPDDLTSLIDVPGLVEGELPYVEPEAEQAELRDADIQRAHSRSILRDDNPRRDSKISSGRDSMKERGKTLSKDRPHGDQPLTDFEPN